MTDDPLAQLEDAACGVRWKIRPYGEKAPNDAPWPSTEPEPPWWERTLAAVTNLRRRPR